MTVLKKMNVGLVVMRKDVIEQIRDVLLLGIYVYLEAIFDEKGRSLDYDLLIKQISNHFSISEKDAMEALSTLSLIDKCGYFFM